jgi:hypothetical protein
MKYRVEYLGGSGVYDEHDPDPAEVEASNPSDAIDAANAEWGAVTGESEAERYRVTPLDPGAIYEIRKEAVLVDTEFDIKIEPLTYPGVTIDHSHWCNCRACDPLARGRYGQ